MVLTLVAAPPFVTSPNALLGAGRPVGAPATTLPGITTVVADVDAAFPAKRPAAANPAGPALPIKRGCAAAVVADGAFSSCPRRTGAREALRGRASCKDNRVGVSDVLVLVRVREGCQKPPCTTAVDSAALGAADGESKLTVESRRTLG